jgi:hypothetical protein
VAGCCEHGFVNTQVISLLAEELLGFVKGLWSVELIRNESRKVNLKYTIL